MKYQPILAWRDNTTLTEFAEFQATLQNFKNRRRRQPRRYRGQGVKEMQATPNPSAKGEIIKENALLP